MPSAAERSRRIKGLEATVARATSVRDSAKVKYDKVVAELQTAEVEPSLVEGVSRDRDSDDPECRL